MTERISENIIFTKEMEAKLAKVSSNHILENYANYAGQEFLLSESYAHGKSFYIVRLETKVRDKLIFSKLSNEQIIVINSDIDICICPIFQMDGEFVYNTATNLYYYDGDTETIDKIHEYGINPLSGKFWFAVPSSPKIKYIQVNRDLSLQTDTISLSKGTLQNTLSSRVALEGAPLNPGDTVYLAQGYRRWERYVNPLIVLEYDINPGYVKVKHIYSEHETSKTRIIPISALTRIPPKKFIKIGERYVPAPITAIPGSEACTLYTVVRTSDGYEAAVVKLGPIDSKAERYVDRYKMPTIKTGYWKAYVDKGYHLDEDSAIAHAAALNAMYNTFYYKDED